MLYATLRYIYKLEIALELMAFTKLSKEEWLKLSQAEKDFITLEFNKSVEQRKRIILYLTRGTALLCVLALFYIGYAQIAAVERTGNIYDKYGSNANCYLCGYQQLRKCECIYWEHGTSPDNMTDYKERLGEYNTQACKGFHVEDTPQGATRFDPILFNFTE